MRKSTLGLIIFLISFLLYSGTISHEFVLDDPGVISQNTMTQHGVKGIPKIFTNGYRSTLTTNDVELYRPFSKAFFAVEWQLFKDNSKAFHFVNVLLYALCCAFLFYILSLYLNSTLFAFLCSLLFAVHPIHTEVAANVKSADEIFVFMFFLFMAKFVYYYLKNDKSKNLIVASVFFLLALFSKESAIVFIAIIPLMIYFFSNASLKKNGTITASLFIPVILFLIIRHSVLGNFTSAAEANTNYLVEIDNYFSQKASAIMLLGNYIKLLFIPYPLMSDGSFHQFPVVTFSDWQFIVSIILLIAMIVYAIVKFRSKSLISFSILYFLITVSLISNIFFLIGTNYGERLMFAPSLAMCLVVSYLVAGKVKEQKYKSLSSFLTSNKKPIMICFAIAIIFSYQTMSRADDWKDDFTLYKKDAETASNSARSHYYLGNYYSISLPELTDNSTMIAHEEAGLSELKKAIEIRPNFDEAYYSIAEIYAFKNMEDSAAENYLKAANINPTIARYQNNYGDMMFRKGNYEEALKRFKVAVSLDSLYTHALTNLGTSYARIGQEYLQKALDAQLKKDEAVLQYNYSLANQYLDTAITWLNKSITLDKDFYLTYYILGIVYQNKNDQETSNYYYTLSEEVRKREEFGKKKR